MSLITPTVDFEKDGKQVGWLNLPHSVTRSAYGVLPIPLAVIQNGPGPQMMFSAGNHGDEYEGQIVLTRLIQSLQPENIKGRLIILPALNMPAAIAGTRVSPLDDGNLNRVFPGDPKGGPTWKIADYVEHHLLPMVEVVVDFHGGGGSLDYRPHVSAHFASDASEEHKRRNLEAARVSGVPHVMVFEKESKSGGGLPDAAVRQGVISIGGEYGGMGNVSRTGVALVRQAVERLLAYFGAKGTLPADLPEPRMMHLPANSHVYAPEQGLFEPATDLGDAVNHGDLCGEVLFPDNPSREPVPVNFEAAGEVVCKRHPGRVERGDCVAHLAAPLEDDV